MNNQTVIVHGPQGCGKTRHAAALAKHYGKTQVVEGDDSYRTAPWETDDAMVITSDSQQARESRVMAAMSGPMVNATSIEQVRAVLAASDAVDDEKAALRDMLEDARNELHMIRVALGVPHEPHQTLAERTLAAAQGAAAWRTLMERADKDKPHMLDIGETYEPIQRMRSWSEPAQSETIQAGEWRPVRQVIFRWIVKPGQESFAEALRAIDTGTIRDQSTTG